MVASAPIYRSMPPSHASAHADAQRRPSGTKVENPFRRIASPIRTPATKLPPSELKATMAERRDAALAANLSASTETRGPSTVMTYGRSGVCGASVMVAARARPVASRINAIEMRRRIDPLSPLEPNPPTGAGSASKRDSRRWASGAMPLGHDARVPAALTGPRERLDDL